MILSILALGVGSFVISCVATWFIKRIAPRVGFVDSPGARKIHADAKPLGGGIAILLGIAVPMLAIIIAVHVMDPPAWPGIGEHWPGLRGQTPLALGLLAAALAMHGLGLWDDRRALGPYVKLAVQLAIITIMVVALDLRSLTALDELLGLGPLPSIVLTVLWIAGITNAFNFLDNMDGLSAGVAAVCAAAFLIAALSIQQWFVAAALAVLLGALIGFLCFNFPPASIFMGDSGSLVIGLVLGFLTVRTQYLPPQMELAAGWYAVFVPVIVLAVPLYDLIVVSLLRLRAGRSPFQGDTNHLSHRLVARGMSCRTAVLCIYLITAATAVAAIVLPQVRTTLAAMLIFAQVVLILCVVALLEQHPLPEAGERPMTRNQ